MPENKSVSNSIVMEGNTVQDAIDKALKLLRVAESQADIEVLSKGKKGFLGIGSKAARVKVAVKEEVAAERDLSNLLADIDLDEIGAGRDEAINRDYFNVIDDKGAPVAIESQNGLAEVQDGNLIIHDPVGEGACATIIPGERIKLIVNGEPIEEGILVSEQDQIEVSLVHDEPESALDLKLSKDKTEAFIRYINHPGAKYKLKDQAPANKLVLKAEIDDIVELPPPAVEEVRQFLEQNKVVKGVMEDTFEEVLNNPNSKEAVLVAKGQRPVDGVNAYVRYLFQEKPQNDESGGLFENNKLVSVNPGEVLAVKVHKKEGQDGWDVTGEVIPHKGALDCEIKVKKGCEIIKGGEEAISSISGRPYLETVGQNTFLSVEPIYSVKEVSQATGNIKFAGDVEVKGDVRDGCVVEAEGNIEVFGNIARATVKAGNSVVIHKMVLGSRVIAGGRSSLYSSIIPEMEKIGQILDGLFAVVEEQKAMMAGLEGDDDGPLIQYFIESRFSGLPKIVIDLSSKVLDLNTVAGEEVLEVVKSLYQNFCGLGPLQMGSIQKIKELRQSLEDIILYMKDFIKKAAYIKARYVQNSTLLCSGDVIIDGQGCYISSIDAGGKVDISGTPGYARGVKIGAGGDVNLKDAGSDFDTQTSVKTAEQSIITAEAVSADVVIQVGKEKHRVMEGARGLRAYLNKEGSLVVDTLKEK